MTKEQLVDAAMKEAAADLREALRIMIEIYCPHIENWAKDYGMDHLYPHQQIALNAMRRASLMPPYKLVPVQYPLSIHFNPVPPEAKEPE
jgi:hypothetical protein